MKQAKIVLPLSTRFSKSYSKELFSSADIFNIQEAQDEPNK